MRIWFIEIVINEFLAQIKKKIHIIFVIKIYILSKIRRKFKSEEVCAENIENTYFQLSSPLHIKWKKIMLVTRVVAI